ncbi:MAG TPA: amidase [Vicinamibacterales bacterium]|nr:amidase [Vicinamibacterales bacterium]
MALSSIDDAARRLRARTVSSVELVEECLRRIDADNGRLNAFILVMDDEARRHATAADRELANGIDRGPLHGMPISVKDLFDIAGTVTTAGSRVRDGIVATRDAAAIANLKRAGAVIIGKTNLHEFAFGTTNEDSAFGLVRHPVDGSRSPGGSSGGSAVSVVAGMALATLGTDTGGSIRIPAAACGLVGLKPSYDELSTAGVVPLSRTADHVGPLTATVTDAWHMLHALRDRAPLKPLASTPLSAVRLGIPRAYFCDLLDADVRGAFDQATDTLRRRGASISEVDIPHAPLIASIYLHIVFGDAAAYHAEALDAMPERYTPNVRLRLEMARYVAAEDYVRALDGRRTLKREVDAAMSGLDGMLLPTLPIVAPTLGATTVALAGRDEPVRNVMLRLTQLFNLTGHPAITLPCGVSPDGLSCGLQLVGWTGQTDTLLHLARSVELALVG